MSETYSPEDLASLTPEERAVLADEPDTQSVESPTTQSAPVFAYVPVYQGPSPEELDAQFAELDRQLEEGDLDIVQYTRQRDPLIQQATEARMVQRAHDLQWRQEQDQFFGQHPEFREDPVLNGALQKVFKSLDTPENSHRSGLELLDPAREQIRESAERVLRERQEHSLADRSDRHSASHSKDFAYLDRLEGRELERALERLSPDQVDDYLRG